MGTTVSPFVAFQDSWALVDRPPTSIGSVMMGGWPVFYLALIGSRAGCAREKECRTEQAGLGDGWCMRVRRAFRMGW